jgi:CHASE2 domain-containing sensor protein
MVILAIVSHPRYIALKLFLYLITTVFIYKWAILAWGWLKPVFGYFLGFGWLSELGCGLG